jgi:hypothetical protein
MRLRHRVTAHIYITQSYICSSSLSQDVPWYEVLEITDVSEKKLEQADGTICWTCGTTCEVWPTQSREALLTKYRDRLQVSFKVEFDNIAKKVVLTYQRRELHSEHLQRKENLAYEIYTKIVMVLEKTFTTKLQPPKSLGLETVFLPCPVSGARMECLLFQRHGFPKAFPHYIIKMAYHKMMEYESCILSPEDIFLKDQCLDAFKVKRAKDAKKRPKAMREQGGGLQFAEVFASFKNFQKDVVAAAAQRDLQQRHADMATSKGAQVQAVRRVRHGRGSDSGDNDEAAKKPKKKVASLTRLGAKHAPGRQKRQRSDRAGGSDDGGASVSKASTSAAGGSGGNGGGGAGLAFGEDQR